MELTKRKEDLVAKVKAFENMMYSERELFRDAIVDYEESFGRPGFLYSDKLAVGDCFDHTLLQFADALGFMRSDTLMEREHLKNHYPEKVSEIGKYDEFQKLEVDVMKAVAEYRMNSPRDMGWSKVI